MELDLNTFSSKELDTLITQAKRRKRVLRKRKSIAVVREKVAELAAVEGYTLGELFPGTATENAPPATAKRATKRGAKRGAKRGRKAAVAVEAAAPAAPSKRAGKRGRSANAGRKVEPKYRNPANPAETWTGRGKPPRWLAAELASGKSKDDFLI